MDKFNTPDKASPVDFDSEIPTYTGTAEGKTEVFGSPDSQKTTAFSRPGRAKPQVISPTPNENAATAVFSASESPDADFAPTVSTPAPSAPSLATAISTPATTVADSTTGSSYGLGPAVEEPEEEIADSRRGTIDFGLLLLRLAFGGFLVFEAIKVFFNLGDGGGLAGMKDAFASYSIPTVLAIAVPAIELTAGVFLVLGLLTPVAAALALVATGFNALHMFVQNDTTSLFSVSPAVTLAVLLLGIALALQFTGPGKIALDFSRSWARRPRASSWIWFILGIVGAGALWWFGAGIDPLA